MPESTIPSGPKLIIDGPLTLMQAGKKTEVPNLTIAAKDGGVSFWTWTTDDKPEHELDLTSPWSFTGGLRLRFETGADSPGFDVPLAGKKEPDRTSRITLTPRAIELRFTLPSLGVARGAVSSSPPVLAIDLVGQSREFKESDFLRCCAQKTISTLDQASAKTLAAVLSTLHDDTNEQQCSAKVQVANGAIRWEFGPLSLAGPVDVKSRLQLVGGSVGFLLSPDDQLLFNSGSSQFSLVTTARWTDLKDGPEVSVEAVWVSTADWLPAALNPPTSSLGKLLFAANQRAEVGRKSLEQVVGGQPESFLPKIVSIVSPTGVPAVLFFKQHCEMSADGVILLPKADPGTRAVVSLLSSIDEEPSKAGPVAKISLPGLGSTEAFEVQLAHDPSCLQTEASTGDVIVSFRLVRPERTPPSTEPQWSTRLGALSLEASKEGGLATEPDHGTSMSRLVITHPRRSIADSNGLSPVGVEWHLRLGVGRVTPEGVDRPWGDRDDRRLPLVVPQWRESKAVGSQSRASAASAAGAPPGSSGSVAANQQQSPFVLVVAESVGPQQDRWLRATLLENSADMGDDAAVSTLLSFEPWSVLRFTRRRLERLGDAENAAVAIFDGDQRTWRVKQAVPEYAFEFPAQGIGESADKPGMLEIHDLSTATEAWFSGDVHRDAQKNILVVRPAPGRPTGDTIERSYLLETRFSPSLELWVKPSDLDRNYILPEWQAHEIFRRRNDFGLGVALRGLRGEFLYGLSVGVDVSKELGPAALARVAEVEALTGKLPPLLLNPSPSPLQSPILGRWRALRRALLRRSERIELWTPAYDQIRPFVHARFEKGATFALRSTALHRHPLPDVPNADASDNRPDAPRLATAGRGLPGGALWPLESSSILDELVGRPAATGGTIERIAISPGGGDADQSVEFADGHVTIASQTRAGFLQRQRIEVLGRIGVFWHRAKHVVVYERTVNPSEQFAPEADAAGWHKTRSRRAVVRKVSEYIEILQPTRSYPDAGPDTGTDCGFLDSVRFNTRVIHVDGSWKTELKDETKTVGYKIPLWNAGAAEQRPNVYPLPSVSAVTLGEGKEKRPLVPRQIANPENLFFFTQTTQPQAAIQAPCDPDSWEPCFGVDYGNLVDPAELERHIAPGGGGYGAPGEEKFAPGRKPSTPRVLPGYHRFTWRLLPDGKRTALNAGLEVKPVYGDLDSITFSRGAVDLSGTEASLAAARSQAAAMNPAVLLKDVANAPSDTLRDKANQFCERATALVRAFKSEKERLDKVPLDCEKLKGLVDDVVSKKRRLIQAIFRDWSLTASRWTDQEIQAAATQHSNQVHEMVADLLGVRQMVEGLLGDVQTGVGSIRADIAAIRLVVTDCVAALRRQVARSTTRFEAALDAADRDVAAAAEWRPKVFTDARLLVVAEMEALKGEIATEADETLRRIAVESTPLAQPIVNELTNALDGLMEKANTLVKDVNALLPAPKDAPAPVPQKTVFDECRKQFASLTTEVERLERDLLRQLDTPVDAIREVLNGTDTALLIPLDSFRASVTEFISKDGILENVCNLPAAFEATSEGKNLLRAWVAARLNTLADDIDSWVTTVLKVSLSKAELITSVKTACDAATEWSKSIVPSDSGLKELRKILLPDDVEPTINAIEIAIRDGGDIAASVKAAEKSFSDWGTAITDSKTLVTAYTSRVSEAVADVKHEGLKPGKVLALMSAATQSPEIGHMQANIDRMRCSYKKAQIETSKAMASFSKLGAALKALGIELPFDGLGDQLALGDTDFEAFREKFDLQRLLPDFGGIKLDGLLEGVKLPETPAEFREAVKLRHEFDKVHFRAWAQIDVNMPIKDRKKLFGIGPMTMYLRDSVLTGSVRAEASKDSDNASTTGSGLIETNIDVDVSGELIVSLEQVRIEYSKEKKLHVDFDPKRIRLHSSMQFVQDTFGDLIGDEIGGLTIVKANELPVGLEHQFKLPVISLMAGTSGISNIQMSNAFRLMAYPDFVLSNRFCLSRPELPFLFTFFLLGGTGYVIVDSRYRPFDKALTVEVEAAIGGAAAFGIASGAIRGQVFITLSVALTYRKTITGGGASGDGLSVAAVLVVAGNVNIAGVVDVYIGVMLRLTYREGGAIDGVGTVTVEVKMSEFYTFKFRSEMTLKMRGGRAETTRKISTSATPGRAVERAKSQVNQMQATAKTLREARA